MKKGIRIERIKLEDIKRLVAILREIAVWLKENGNEMWNIEKLTASRFKEKYQNAKLYMCYVDDVEAAVFILMEENKRFWPDVRNGESLYLKKLGVRRQFAKTGLSTNIINWIKEEAIKRNKSFIRLEIFADVIFLDTFYKEHGFRFVKEVMSPNQKRIGIYEYKVI